MKENVNIGKQNNIKFLCFNHLLTFNSLAFNPPDKNTIQCKYCLALDT